jgi:hypothetical protein
LDIAAAVRILSLPPRRSTKKDRRQHKRVSRPAATYKSEGHLADS